MDELLKALQHKDKRAVQIITRRLFMTKDGRVNWAQINEFQSYAPCKVSAFTLNKGMKTSLGGRLVYNDTVYSLG